MSPQLAEALRLARTPRWLGILALAIVLAIGCIVLGRWQLDRTLSILDAERAAQQAPIAVEQVVSAEGLPNESIGRPVIARGTYVAGAQFAILQRSLDGRAGVWMLAPLRLADGSIIGVLRGWLPAADAPGASPPDGPVEVAGVLHPDEGFYADAVTAPGTLVAITGERLRAAWGERTLPGYVMLTSEAPAMSPAPIPVPPTVQTADVPFPLRNFVYALQWWIFAGFVLVVAVRWLWMDATRPQETTVTS